MAERQKAIKCAFCGKTGDDVNKAGVYPACKKCRRKHG